MRNLDRKPLPESLKLNLKPVMEPKQLINTDRAAPIDFKVDINSARRDRN